jgi:hypothetical protein
MAYQISVFRFENRSAAEVHYSRGPADGIGERGGL